MGKIPFVVLVALIVSVSVVFCLDPQKNITQYHHEIWMDGLPQSSVLSITQTKDGYLWFGTHEGLVRFNGAEFTIFDKHNTKEIQSNSISALLEDRSGVLWIGTLSGGVICSKGGVLKTYRVVDGLVNDFVYSIYEDRDKGIWIGTSGGVSYFKDGKFITYTTADGLSNNAVRAICEDSLGNIWVGTESGLNIFQKGKFENYRIDGIANSYVSSLCNGGMNGLWIGLYGGGICNFKDGKFTSYTIQNGLSNNLVSTLFQDSEQLLWIGTEGGGLSRFQEGKFSTYNSRHGLSQDHVRSFYEDREGNFWIGTNVGLNCLKNSKFTSYSMQEGLSNENVRVVCEGNNGDIWIGTDGGGVNCLRNGVFSSYTTKNGLSSNFVKSLCEDKSGNLWIGTTGGGLNKLKDGKFKVYTSKDGLKSDVVYAIYEDKIGNIWIGTYGGGFCCFKDEKFISYTIDSSNHIVRAISEDHEGAIWIGTEGGGLYKFKNGVFTNYTTKNGLASDVIFAIYEDAEQNLWVGTDNGLCSVTKEKISIFTRTDGLFDDKIFQILEDSQENLWMSCNKGIFRVSKQNLRSFAAKELKLINCVSYDKADGMRSSQCNGASQPAGWKSRDGKLWFPTVAGLVVIDSEAITYNVHQPPVIIEQIFINNTLVDTNKSIEFPIGAGNLEIRYAGLSFVAPEKTRFKYKLEGFDRDWVDAGSRRAAYYTNLQSGNYVFSVMACNNDGVWSTKGASIKVYLKPQFYKTFWAYFIYLAVISGVSYGGFRFRWQALKQRNEELELKIQERTTEINKAMNVIQLSERKALEANRAKSAFIANMSHELRTPLNAILGFVQLMLGDPKRSNEDQEKLAIITRSGEHLLELINDVLSISKIEAGQVTVTEQDFDLHRLLTTLKELFQIRAANKGLGFMFDIDSEMPKSVVGDEGKIRQILMNLLSNAFKFTASGSVALHGKWEGSRAVFEVEDTGPGISEEDQKKLFEAFVQTQVGQQVQEGTGLGLAISRNFARLLNGDLVVRSEVGVGSVFRFEIPLRVSIWEVTPKIERRVVGLEPGQPTYRILVVDDKQESRELLIRLLESFGFEVQEAANGKEAIEIWSSWQPHLIWMDMHMPIMDGYTTTKNIRDHDKMLQVHNPEYKDSRVRIIALTASVLEHERDEVIAAGCDDFVAKPFKVETIFEKLTKHLGVQFRYEDVKSNKAPSSTPMILTSEMLAALPQELLSSLNEAVIRGDIEDALATADKIRDENDQLADELKVMIKNYRFDEIQDLIAAI